MLHNVWNWLSDFQVLHCFEKPVGNAFKKDNPFGNISKVKRDHLKRFRYNHYDFSFRFYHSFNYKTDVISPRCGKVLNKDQLISTCQLNLSDVNIIFKRTYIAIQDPFVVQNN